MSERGRLDHAVVLSTSISSLAHLLYAGIRYGTLLCAPRSISSNRGSDQSISWLLAPPTPRFPACPARMDTRERGTSQLRNCEFRYIFFPGGAGPPRLIRTADYQQLLLMSLRADGKIFDRHHGSLQYPVAWTIIRTSTRRPGAHIRPWLLAGACAMGNHATRRLGSEIVGGELRSSHHPSRIPSSAAAATPARFQGGQMSATC